MSVNRVLFGNFLLSAALAVVVSFPLEAHAAESGAIPEPTQQWVERLERHWQQLLAEKNTEQRRRLIHEHRALLQRAAEAAPKDPVEVKGAHRDDHHAGMAGRHRVDLMNTLAMHRHMLEMLE